MAFGRSQVNVCGIPADMCEDDLSLFFESRRFCPSGGQVENVDLDFETHTATVTFCNCEGIFSGTLQSCGTFQFFAVTLQWPVTIFLCAFFNTLLKSFSLTILCV